MENSFKISTRDPTERADYGSRGEEDIDAAVEYSRARTDNDRVRRQMELHRINAAENYVRDNLVRVKGASRGNYCQKKYGQQARELNAQAIFKDEECIGRAQPTYREHPDIPGLQVEDVCTLCVRDQARAIRDERGEWVASEYSRKAGINRGTGAGEEEEEYAQLRTPPVRTVRAMPAPRIQPAPPVMPPPAAANGMVMVQHTHTGEMVVDEENLHRLQRRQEFYAQRDARRESARRTVDSSRPNPQPPQSQTRFGMSVFTNKAHAPESVFLNNTLSKKKKNKKKSSKKQKKQTKRRN